MALDSTANLLFVIGADSSDAQANVQRFRSILSKDLDGLKGEFDSWSKKVFGDLGTVGGAFTAAAAGIAAAAVAIGAGLMAAADRAAKYALELDDASDQTGIAVEDMARLRYAASMTGTSYSSLQTSLAFLARTIYQARDAGSAQAETFRRLGISQKEVEAGSRNMLPLLYRVADAFHNDLTAVERSAVARELFSRGGTVMVEMLSRGSGAMRLFAAEAERLGLVIGDKAVEDAARYQAELAMLKAAFDGLAISIGTRVLPVLNTLAIGAEATFAGLAAAAKAGLNPAAAAIAFTTAAAEAGQRAYERLEAAASQALTASGRGLEAPGEIAKKTTKEFEGLSGILETVRGRLAGQGTEEEQLVYDMGRLIAETGKAAAELRTLKAADEITAETFERESAALAAMPMKLIALQGGLLAEIQRKRDEEAARRQAKLDKIEAERAEAYVRELRDLQQHLAAIVTARMTSAERLGWQYEQDLERFSEVEESKALLLAKNEAEADTMRQQFALNRQVALTAYETGLTQLANSTGWRGVFGAEFANSIRGNEALLREWSESADQSMMMVRVSVEALNESAQRAFGQFAQAMGTNIANAVIYRKSVGEAMRAAAAAALESLAAQAIGHAIYSTALGFLRLAEFMPGSAAQAFTAAAIFGSVGAVAAVAGRAVAPQQAGAGASAGGSGGSGGTGGSAGAPGGSNGREGPRVVIYVQGPVVGTSGIEELTDMINEAVQGRDVQLVATRTR